MKIYRNGMVISLCKWINYKANKFNNMFITKERMITLAYLNVPASIITKYIL